MIFMDIKVWFLKTNIFYDFVVKHCTKYLELIFVDTSILASANPQNPGKLVT